MSPSQLSCKDHISDILQIQLDHRRGQEDSGARHRISEADKAACSLPRGVLQAPNSRHLDRDLDNTVALQILPREISEVVTIVLTAAVENQDIMDLLQTSIHRVDRLKTVAVIHPDTHRFRLQVQDSVDIRYYVFIHSYKIIQTVTKTYRPCTH